MSAFWVERAARMLVLLPGAAAGLRVLLSEWCVRFGGLP